MLLFLAYFSYFENITLGLCDLHVVCAAVYALTNNFVMAETIFMKLGMYHDT
jgi:hypothetical protein